MDEVAGGDQAGADAEAIDSALAAVEDACAQLVAATDGAVDHPDGRRHLAAVRDRLAADSVPITASTADDLLIAAADARAALQRFLGVTSDSSDGETADEDAEGLVDDEDPFVESDPVLDLAPEADLDDEPAAPPPPPLGYQASTALPTRNLAHVLVFEDGRWQRGSIAFAPDDTLMVRLATARRGPGRRVDEYSPAQIARPLARG